MKRPAGVTASAIVAIIGSVFALLLAVMSIASLFIATPEPRPANASQFIIAGAAMIAAFGVFGIWTASGLFSLRPRARTSILVFAGFLASISIFGLLVTLTVPISPETAANTQLNFRLGAVIYGMPLLISIWWLIQFNKPSTKAAFASSIDEPASPRPISITVIAWASIIGGAGCLAPLFGRMPAFLFGFTFTGWIASIIYAVLAALSFYIGKGLLDLREEARVLAIGWDVFSLVQLGAITLVPPLRQRMFAFQRVLDQSRPTPISFDLDLITNFVFVYTTILGVAAIWFLIRNRAAFVHTFAD